MKILRFNRHCHKGPRQAAIGLAALAPNLPRLPTELWRKIIAFMVRIAGSASIELDDPCSMPYKNEEYPIVDPYLFQDRKSLSLVCSGWYSIVVNISAEYLVIYSAKQLKKLVKKLECDSNKRNNGKCLGEWTTRIDFKILGEYSVAYVVRLLRTAPNLLIYNNHNGPPDIPQRYTPVKIIQGLVEHCGQSLRRVEWSGAGEPPRYQDLVKLCNGLPNLVTLRLMAIYSFPCPQDWIVPPILILPKLKTLSLAIIPEIPDIRHQYELTWDLLLHYLSITPHQLPSLERFECDIFPRDTMAFFNMHGHKIGLFRTTTWSAQDMLSEALELCPNLHILVIAQGSEVTPMPVFHPSLQKICIFPTVDVEVSVPQRVYQSAVITPLDTLLKSLERMVAPQLVELRIRNIGAYVNIIEHGTWLRFWCTRWNICGVRFCDKAGTSYQYSRDPQESLLDSVRG